MRPLIRLSALLFTTTLLIAQTTVSVAQDYRHDEVIENSFDLDSGGLLLLDSDLGSVVIEGGGSEVMVRVVKGTNRGSRSDAEDLFERFEITFDQSGSRLEIHGDYDKPSGRINWGKNGLRVHYEISVPEDIDLDIKTSGGSISAEDIAGDAQLKTSGGSIQLEDIGGTVIAKTSGGSIQGRNLGDEVNLDTSGGSITVEGAGGPLDAETSGGSIRISDVDGPVDASTSGGSIRLSEIAGSVNAKTSGGSIEAQILGQPDEDMLLKTSGGTVTVHLDESVQADIDAKASGGSVKTDFPISVRGTIKRSQLQGEINGGGPLLTLRSSGGSVRIREN